MIYDIAYLRGMTQVEMDALFTAREAGPIPEGEPDSTPIIPADTVFTLEIGSFLNFFTWRDKVFVPKSGTLIVRNDKFGLAGVIGKVYKAPSWVDGKESIVVDYSETTGLAKWMRDEIRLVQEPGLYLGKVFWDRNPLIGFALQF